MSVFNSRRAATPSREESQVQGREPRNLRRFHAALARLRTTGYRPRILFVGDSKTMGAGAGTDAASVGTIGAAARNLTFHLAKRLAERGLPVSRQSFVGLCGLTSPAAFAAYDPRVSAGSGWTSGTGIWTSAGGAVLIGPNGITAPLLFMPGEAVDRVEVHFFKGAAVGEFTVSDGATLRATIDANAASLSFARHTVMLSNLGEGKSIAVMRTATRTSSIYIAALVAYDGTRPAIDILNAGWFGSRSRDWTDTSYPWSPANALAAHAPDLTVIALGANDMSQSGSVPVAAFRVNLQLLIDKAKLSGDVVLVVETFGASPAWGDATTQADYRQAILETGASNGCMVIDLSARFGNFAEAEAQGFFFDKIHESALGYADEAQALANALLL